MGGTGYGVLRHVPTADLYAPCNQKDRAFNLRCSRQISPLAVLAGGFLCRAGGLPGLRRSDELHNLDRDRFDGRARRCHRACQQRCGRVRQALTRLVDECHTERVGVEPLDKVLAELEHLADVSGDAMWARANPD